jgi:protein involved in polysaccharide export with SLBB domain
MSFRLMAGLAAALLVAPPVSAQEPWDPGRIQVTRADLEALLRRLDSATVSPTYSQPIRDRARTEAAQIRARLAQGDFQVGDRISLVVEGEQALSDTFAVRDGRVLRLPTVGDVALAGILRSELEDHLRVALAKYLRDPVVRARSLIRLSLLGEVGRPGFYVVPTDMVLSDALMLAGGPTGSANLTDVRIERSGQRVWGAAPLQDAIAQGRTLDQLDLRAGDQVVVPKKKTGPFNEGTVRTVSLVLSIPIAIFGLVQLFK